VGAGSHDSREGSSGRLLWALAHTAPALATHSTVRDPTLTRCVCDAQDESRRAALVSALVLAGCVDVEVTAGRVSGRKPAWEVRKQAAS
jgi:hypothetical protein